MEGLAGNVERSRLKAAAAVRELAIKCRFESGKRLGSAVESGFSQEEHLPN